MSLTACDGVGARPASYAVRDSAGVEIVESTAPAWREGEEWRLSAEPVLQIGVLDGPAEYQFERATRALRRSDGGIVVADAGMHALRFYDADGRFVSSAGGEGEGPGEFRYLSFVQTLPGDSLFAFDYWQRRASYFAPDGAFVRSFSLTGGPETGYPDVIGRLTDGSLLATVGHGARAGERKTGLFRDTAQYLRYSAEGVLLDTTATLPGREMFRLVEGNRATERPALFGRGPVYAVLDNGVVLGTNEAYELGIHSPDGALERLIRRRQDPRPVTRADHAALMQEELDGMETVWRAQPRWRDQGERTLREMPLLSIMPFYTSARADDGGNLWVQDFRAPGEEPRWTVFDAGGRMLGQVALPERFRPTHFGEDFVLGIWRDDMDVQYVQMFALQKARSAPRAGAAS